jgi:hypothetical protein
LPLSKILCHEEFSLEDTCWENLNWIAVMHWIKIWWIYAAWVINFCFENQIGIALADHSVDVIMPHSPDLGDENGEINPCN